MCGITGLVDLTGGSTEDELRRYVSGMTESLHHRGPDAGGVWLDPRAGIALGQRRLSIFDLSEAGAQPMVSGNGRFIIVYNGETYNFQNLRQELEREGARFRGNSDTEVILEACALWGVQKTIPRLNGMFAFALWDREDRTLTLILDRFGIKPLYWHSKDNLFLFGSELKALRAHPNFSGAVDRGAFTAYLRLGYVSGPDSIYQDVQKLMPGTILTLRVDAEPVIQSYWDMHEVARTGLETPLTCTEKEVADKLEALLCNAVQCRMESDVPLGAFLSGGVDSSTIVALMQSCADRPVKTFSIGFDEAGYDEAAYAAGVAHHLGTDHTELYVSEQDALDLIPKLPFLYDEPFADSSQIPTHLVSCLARQHVTVSLSGDGGDELFGGYNRHVFSERLNRVNRFMPLTLRKRLAQMIALTPDFAGNILAFGAGGDPPQSGRYPQFKEKLQKIVSALSAKDSDEMYRQFTSVWSDSASLVVGSPTANTDTTLPNPISMGPAQQMMLADMVGYLPGDILAKVDRASMGIGLECRVPFLDYRVVEFAWRIPFKMNVRQGKGKRLLREILYHHVPKSLIERPKSGFAIPIGVWLKGPLRDWAEDLLNERRLSNQGFMDPRPIRDAWSQHLEGRKNREHELWAVLMFQAWLAHSEPTNC